MKKNVSSQIVGVQMITAADGTAFSGSVTCYVTGDNGTQTLGTVGSGVCASKGNGLFNYAPSQAETNYNFIQFTFIGTGAITQTLPVYTDFPQTGDAYDVGNTRLPAALTADGNMKSDTLRWNGVAVTGMPMPTYAQPTGFLAATFPSIVSSFAGGAVASVTGNVSGNVTGSVGSISGVTFPANFAALSISASTGLVDITQTAADKVWTTGTRTITGGTIGTITGLTIAGLENMQSRFATMIVQTGATWQYTSTALELAPAGSGLTAQQTRDAMKLAPTAGSPAAGSIDAELDSIPRAGAGPFTHTNISTAEAATVAIT